MLNLHFWTPGPSSHCQRSQYSLSHFFFVFVAGAQFDPCLFPQLVPWCHSCPDFSLHWDQKPWEWFNKDGPGEVTIQYFSSAIRDQLTEEPGQIWEVSKNKLDLFILNRTYPQLGDAVSCQVSGLNQDIENGAMDEVGVSISTPSSWNGSKFHSTLQLN